MNERAHARLPAKRREGMTPEKVVEAVQVSEELLRKAVANYADLDKAAANLVAAIEEGDWQFLYGMARAMVTLLPERRNGEVNRSHDAMTVIALALFRLARNKMRS